MLNEGHRLKIRPRFGVDVEERIINLSLILHAIQDQL